MIVVLAIGVAMALVASKVAAPKSVAAPAVDHRLDQVEHQFAATGTLSTDNSLNSVFDNAHAAPYVAGPALSTDEYLNNILDRAHATPFAVGTVTPLVSATSGTFHPGWQPVAPAKTGPR